MGAFAFVRLDPASREGTCRHLEKSFERQGFGAPRVVEMGDYRLYLYQKQVAPSPNFVEYPGGDFCASTGTLLCDGQTGIEALRSLYENFDPTREHEDCYGSFCVILRKSGRTFVWLDRLGIYKVFRRSDDQVWSSSFLATAQSFDRLVCCPQEIYEFVFQGATYGWRTIARDIELVRNDAIFEVGESVAPWARTQQLPTTQSPDSFDQLIERNLANLRRYFSAIAANFRGRIDTALSGGYDSRLTLALLLEQGAQPRVHVYGRASDADVQIARRIDAGEGLGLEHIDKSQRDQPTADAVAATVEANFWNFDGYPTDGLFNNGADLMTRRERCANGELMLNGGGGEIFRNFFYLPDGGSSVGKVLRSFYSAFDPQACTEHFREADYHGRLGQKIQDTLGAETDRLTRQQVEQIYPLFRCRFWMGRNNAVNNRLGSALTPFIDYPIVRDAVGVPIRWKNYGRFEAEMIRRVNPKLAAYPSAYGHSFSEPPNFRHRLGEIATRWRPTALRQRSFRLRTRLRPAPVPDLLGPAVRQAVLGDRLDYMERLFRPASIRDPGQLNRLLSLEYLLSNLSAEIARG